MRLASADEVLLAAGVQNPNEATLLHAGAMLDISYTLLQSLIETEFYMGSMVDSFLVRRTASVSEFRLTNGFVDIDSVKVYSAPTSGSPYAAIDPLYLLSEGQYAVRAREGVVVVDSLYYTGPHALVVTYDHGFRTRDNDDTVLDAPSDLKAIAVNAAILALNTFPSTPGNRKEKTAANVSGVIYGHLVSSIGHLRRPRLTVDYPLFSAIYD